MSITQIEAVGVTLGMLCVFATNRLRYDLVALVALLAGAVLGIVPPEHAFEGFGNPVIIIIASALVVGKAITRSGVIDVALRRILDRLDSPSAEIALLTGCVAMLSAFLKNVGTLSIFMPIAIRAARRRHFPEAAYLMSLSFASLIGGTITLIGTSPNLLISIIRQRVVGQPFQLFDFVPVGLPLTVAAIAFLSVGWRLTPRNRRGQSVNEERFEIGHYRTEFRIQPDSPMVGKRVAELEKLAGGELSVTGIIREGGRRYIPSGRWQLAAHDILEVQGDPAQVEKVADRLRLAVLPADEPEPDSPGAEAIETAEAIILPQSLLVGRTSRNAQLRRHYEVNVLSIGSGEKRIDTRLHEHRFRPWDVILLQGREDALADAVAALQCLPLADRGLALRKPRNGMLPIAILGGALALVALGKIPIAVAFVAAATLVTLLGCISLKDAYNAIDWPVVVMLGALIPIGESLHRSGVDTILAQVLADVGHHLPGPAAIAMVLLVAMLLTPLIHHAAAVLVLGPLAATLASRLGYHADPFLMAVALGASCDFLTPIGHQNNALVMAPGGYRFGDYWRLGLPLSCIVVLLGTPLILLSWPL